MPVETSRRNTSPCRAGGVKKEPRSFTDEEMGRVIAAASEPYGTIFSIAATLGLRVGETLALRVSDIDFTQKIVRIRQSVDAATRRIQAVKSDASSADVPMPSQLEKRLKGYLGSSTTRQNDSDLLFINKRGRPFNANKLRTKCFTRYLRNWGSNVAVSTACATVLQCFACRRCNPGCGAETTTALRPTDNPWNLRSCDRRSTA